MATITGLTGEVFDETDICAWEYFNPPYYWQEINGEVIADRTLPDGTRQHMVRGHVTPGMVVCNAQIVGQACL
jgi:hypothetical protein